MQSSRERGVLTVVTPRIHDLRPRRCKASPPPPRPLGTLLLRRVRERTLKLAGEDLFAISSPISAGFFRATRKVRGRASSRREKKKIRATDRDRKRDLTPSRFSYRQSEQLRLFLVVAPRSAIELGKIIFLYFLIQMISSFILIFRLL